MPAAPDGFVLFRPAWNAKGFYERWLMVDEREHLKGGITGWEKFKIGSFGVVAVSLLIIAFLAFISTQDGDIEAPPLSETEVAGV